MFAQLTHDGLCAKTLGGLQVIWVAQLIAGIILWLALLMIPCVHAYHHQAREDAEAAANEGERGKGNKSLASLDVITASEGKKTIII
jgi:hypothetical protein